MTYYASRLFAFLLASMLAGASIASGDDSVSREAVDAFHAGVLLHNSGAYLDAMPHFRRALSFDDRLVQTFDWLQSCFRLADFSKVADNYVAAGRSNRLRELMLAKPDSAPLPKPQQGVAFVGVTGAPERRADDVRSVTMLLIDSLSRQTAETVILSEKLVAARRDYDSRTPYQLRWEARWEEGAKLCGEMVTAHFVEADRGLRLTLRAVHHLDPTQIDEASIALGNNSAKWRAKIDRVVARLYPRLGRAADCWTPPELLEDDPEAVLLKRLNDKFSDVDCLKLLARHPEHYKFIADYPYQRQALSGYRIVEEIGLEAWSIGRMSVDDPQRPWHEFSYQGNLLGLRELQSDPADFVEDSKRLARRYRNHPVGLACRYNLLLMRLSTGNVAAIQPKLDQVVSEFERLNADGTQQAAATMRRVERGLRYLLGKPGGAPVMLVREASLLGGTLERINVGNFGTPTFDSPVAMPASIEQMQIELRAYLSVRDRNTIPLPLLEATLERYGANSPATKYASVRFLLAAINHGVPHEAESDAAQLISVYTTTIVEFLTTAPAELKGQEAGTLFLPYRSLIEAWPNNPVIRECRARAKQAAIESLEKGRFSHLSDASIDWLLSCIAIGRDADCERIARQRADSCWDRDPLNDQRWLQPVHMISDAGGSKREIAAIYQGWIPSLSRLYPRPDTPRVAKLYAHCALALFAGEKYDDARPLLDRLASEPTRDREPTPPQVTALTWYLLGLLQQRAGNATEALAHAERALVALGERPVTLCDFYYVDGSFSGLVLGVFQTRINDMLVALRRDPHAPFSNPFADAQAQDPRGE